MVIAAAYTGIAAAIAAIFVGLLYISDNPRLLSLNRIQRDCQAIKRGGYDVADLAAPRDAGFPFRVLTFITRPRVIGHLVCRHLYDKNNMLQVRRVVASVPDQPLYNLIVDPSHVDSADTTEPLELVAFSRKNTDAKQHFRNSFRHSTIRNYTSRYASGKLSPVQVVRAVFAAADESEWGH